MMRQIARQIDRLCLFSVAYTSFTLSFCRFVSAFFIHRSRPLLRELSYPLKTLLTLRRRPRKQRKEKLEKMKKKESQQHGQWSLRFQLQFP